MALVGAAEVRFRKQADAMFGSGADGRVADLKRGLDNIKTILEEIGGVQAEWAALGADASANLVALQAAVKDAVGTGKIAGALAAVTALGELSKPLKLVEDNNGVLTVIAAS